MGYENKKQSGFTLIELLVVIAIIGILSAVVLASLSDARMSAKDSAAKQLTQSIVTQVEIYRNNNPNLVSLRKNDMRTHISGRSCSDRNFPGTVNPFGAEFEKLCESIEDIVEHPTNTYYMYWGYRERVGSGGYTWQDDGFAILVRLNSGKWFCANTNGARQEGSWTEAVIGCRDVTL